jgi:mRNA-degrading endonuclease toxin of MazEF toxin-antitoxin module
MSVTFKPKKGNVYKLKSLYKDKGNKDFHMYVVIQNNRLLKQIQDINVVEITSKKLDCVGPFDVILPEGTLFTNKQTEKCRVKCSFLYHVSRDELLNGQFCGEIPEKIMEEIDTAIGLSLGLFSGK